MPDNNSENIPEQIPAAIPEVVALPVRQEAGPEPQEKQPDVKRDAFSVIVAIAGWIFPGLGHLIQRRFGRAIAGFVVVGTLAVVGLLMRGNVFPAQSNDAFGLLGFVADAGSGMFYLLAHTIQKGGPDVSRAAGDYGTRLIATSGVLNMLFVLDALEISRGHKN